MLWLVFVAPHHVFTMTTTMTMFSDLFFAPLSLHSAAHGTVKRFAAPCLALIMLLCTFTAGAQAPTPSPQLNLARTQLTAGMHRLDVQLAQTPEQRQIGLMWRKDMPQHEGMLFVFEQASTQCFWMRNTLLPLTAAFVEDDGTIVNLADMQPQSDDSHCSSKPVRLVLEMNQGWFAKRQIKPGYKLGGAVFSKRPD